MDECITSLLDKHTLIVRHVVDLFSFNLPTQLLTSTTLAKLGMLEAILQPYTWFIERFLGKVFSILSQKKCTGPFIYLTFVLVGLKPMLHNIIGHYNPSVRTTAQLLTPLMLCASILCVSGGTYSLMSTSNDRYLRNLFMAEFIYSPSICQKSAESKSPDKKKFYFIFRFDA